MAFSIFALLPYISLQAHIDGTYKVRGFDPYINQEYTGTALIERNGDIYNILWTFDTGTQELGTGVRKDDQLSVVFRNIENPDVIGVQAYEIHHHHLKGPWASLGGSLVGIESLRKID